MQLDASDKKNDANVLQKGLNFLAAKLRKSNPQDQGPNSENNTDNQEIDMMNNNDLNHGIPCGQACAADNAPCDHQAQSTYSNDDSQPRKIYNCDPDNSGRNFSSLTPAETDGCPEEAEPCAEPTAQKANYLDPALEEALTQVNSADAAACVHNETPANDCASDTAGQPAEADEPAAPPVDPLIDARNAAMEILEDAEKKAAQIIAEANRKADQITTEATAKLKQALYEKQETLAAANRQYDFIVKNAENEKRAILERCADEEVRQLVAARLHGYFEDGNAQEARIRQNLNDNYGIMAMDHSALITNVDKGAQNIQSTITQALRQIRDAQDQMQQELDNWRRQLYKVDYRDMAVCYTNLDKMIGGMERRLAKELSYGDEGYHGELARELKRYVQNMKVFRTTFESCLAKLGIKAYYPAPGTPFNSYLHTFVDLDPEYEDDASFNDKPIIACVKPGLVRVTQHGEDSLLPALVTVDRNS